MFITVSHFRPSLIFAGKSKSLALEWSPTSRYLAKPQRLARDKHSSIVKICDEEKNLNFIIMKSWAMSIKLFTSKTTSAAFVIFRHYHSPLNICSQDRGTFLHTTGLGPCVQLSDWVLMAYSNRHNY